MLVHLGDGSTQTIVCAVTLRQKLQIKLAISPSHSILTPGRPVPALTLYRQAPGRVATGVTGMRLDQEKSRRKRDSNSGPSAFGADSLTTYHLANEAVHTSCAGLSCEVCAGLSCAGLNCEVCAGLSCGTGAGLS